MLTAWRPKNSAQDQRAHRAIDVRPKQPWRLRKRSKRLVRSKFAAALVTKPVPLDVRASSLGKRHLPYAGGATRGRDSLNFRWRFPNRLLHELDIA